MKGYAIGRAFASGGMATVYLGTAPDGARVAIKRLHPHLGREEAFVTMLLDEARLARRIVHPNVVRAIDVVSNDDEIHLVMEYVHGVSASALVRAGATPLSIAVAIVLGTLRGLHAAHIATSDAGTALDLVHRDVSPQNVLVGADGVARLTDFGVAKAAGRLRSTRDGSLKGKLAYMSPEQAANDPVDARTDVYSAALVLWELCAGKPVFDAASDAALFGRVLRGPTRRFADDVPEGAGALDALVMRALARDRMRRPPTAASFADALEAIVTPAAPDTIATFVEARWGASLRARTTPIPRAPRVTARFVAIAAGALFAVTCAVALRSGAVIENASAQTRITPDTNPQPAPPIAALPSTPALPAPEGKTEKSDEPAPKREITAPKKRVEAPKARASAARPSCDPPYTVENGIRHFKEACVR